jgi:hypothetical protein
MIVAATTFGSAPQSDVFAVEVDIFKIPSLGDNNGIAVVGVIDSSLYVIEICRAVVVNVDDFSCEGRGCRRQDEYHYKRRDYAICSRTHFVLLEKNVF